MINFVFKLYHYLINKKNNDCFNKFVRPFCDKYKILRKGELAVPINFFSQINKYFRIIEVDVNKFFIVTNVYYCLFVYNKINEFFYNIYLIEIDGFFILTINILDYFYQCIYVENQFENKKKMKWISHILFIYILLSFSCLKNLLIFF